MEKDVIYFVQDAYGYLVYTDEFGFNDILNIWKDHDCNFTITKEVHKGYIVIKLWRV